VLAARTIAPLAMSKTLNCTIAVYRPSQQLGNIRQLDKQIATSKSSRGGHAQDADRKWQLCGAQDLSQHIRPLRYAPTTTWSSCFVGLLWPVPMIRDGAGINVQGSDQDSGSGEPGSAYQGPINNMVVVARNQVHGAGVLVSGHTHNVLVDANHITKAPVGADVWHADVERGHVKHALVLNGTD
jgi:hypothetical protein